MDQTAQTRYSRTAIVLHWAIAALILTTIPLGWYGASAETASTQAATNLHKTIGVCILALSLVRLGWRLMHKPPALPAEMKPALRHLARATHILFYVLLLAMPLSGWWMSSAVPERHAFGFGLFDIPFLPVPRGFASAGPAFLAHMVLGWVMIGLVGLHVIAALKHHFIDRDAVLARMLPRRA